MKSANANRFQDFFENDQYVTLKNYLYNYLLRKRAVEKAMRSEKKEIVLETGSGISPVLTSWDNVVYTDLSSSALDMLKKIHGKGQYVVADAMNLPFDDCCFSHVISSEVLEHLEDDRKALMEIARVIKPDGTLIVTFPHRHFYFSHDDRYVNHYRRYELAEMISLLAEAGFQTEYVRKVLGPLEKITMWAVTICASGLESWKAKGDVKKKQKNPGGATVKLFQWGNKLYAGIAWLDALIMPRSLSAVLLIKAKKKQSS
ncbi:MAG: class I SAM-dependent methyltransferase [Smithellaceae bacterium]|nr:class I SAM-dependent methyltransferase [Smithellaceae bacterium]